MGGKEKSLVSEKLAVLFEDICGKKNVLINESMKKHTSFKVGGPADFFVTPENHEQLASLLKNCFIEKVPVYIMGNGSNLIVRDKGFRGVIIETCTHFNSCEVIGDVLVAEAGILLSKLSNIAYRNSLTGFEFASGIPGSLGGAITMNAGAYGGEMKDIVTKTLFLDKSGELGELTGDQHCFGYRQSYFQQHGGIALKSWIQLKKGNKSEIKARMDELAIKRKEKQPLEFPSAGSVFKRPQGYYTWQLVDGCNLRGFTIGGAQVSEKHCGFIINIGNATASDVLNLIKHVQDKVRDGFGVELHPEVRIIGEE